MTDGAIVVLSASGPTDDGFDAVYRTHYAEFVRVVVAITADRHVAEEVVQEAFLTAQRRWSRISEYDRPELWVRRVAINRALSWRRRLSAEARAVLRFRARPAEPLVEPEPVVAPIWRHVRELPRRQAAIVALVYVQDMTIEEAAEALGIATPTAKTHLQRARRRLAEKLNEENQHDR